jgi:hypothetical protein
MFNELWFARNALDVAISGRNRQIQADYKFEARYQRMSDNRKTVREK